MHLNSVSLYAGPREFHYLRDGIVAVRVRRHHGARYRIGYDTRMGVYIDFGDGWLSTPLMFSNWRTVTLAVREYCVSVGWI
jgi:hypothetical protein